MIGTNLIAAHLDHPRSHANYSYVYPVISRRSRGLSIGINLNPDKNCNFNCGYCEVDLAAIPKRRNVNINLLTEELRAILQSCQDGTLFESEPFASVPHSWRRLNDIAFSGDGEPTTCPLFEEAVNAVWQVREETGLEEVKLVLITNGTCLNRPTVQRSIRQMQAGAFEIWAKLDAGTNATYRAINRAHIPYARVLRNITQTACWCPLIIQSLFLRRSGKPPDDNEILAYSARLNEIQAHGGKILSLHLYTIARRARASWASALSDDELKRIATMVNKWTGLTCEVFYGNSG